MHCLILVQLKLSPRVQAHKQYLLGRLKYTNIAYFGLVGLPGYAVCRSGGRIVYTLLRSAPGTTIGWTLNCGASFLSGIHLNRTPVRGVKSLPSVIPGKASLSQSLSGCISGGVENQSWDSTNRKVCRGRPGCDTHTHTHKKKKSPPAWLVPPISGAAHIPRLCVFA